MENLEDFNREESGRASTNIRFKGQPLPFAEEVAVDPLAVGAVAAKRAL